ncbi:HD domain-containing protein [Pectinatus sottacetonis]|uniref:HD domain-containing protein n=1 Tax=Pectinatus sottacetonis TaxID=1002795 RepID=UPI0018C66FDF|nr:HD domain-containing protein [Pectinatus sottacetonis]
MMKRIVQFYRAVTADLSYCDELFIKAHLSDKELKLFNDMNAYDKCHAVNVAVTAEKMAEQRVDINNELLIKAALLHDIGRDRYTNLWDKVFTVIICSISKSLSLRLAEKNARGIGGKWRRNLYICINHAELSAQKLEKINQKSIAAIVRQHHAEPLPDDNEELVILRKADELN